jgi:hypothetical protein
MPKKTKINRNLSWKELVWGGAIAGVGFQVISIGILYIILLNFLIDVFSVEVLFLILNISFILTIVSGGIAAYLSRSRNYLDGIINGLLVGLICVILLGIFRNGIFAFFLFFYL